MNKIDNRSSDNGLKCACSSCSGGKPCMNAQQCYTRLSTSGKLVYGCLNQSLFDNCFTNNVARKCCSMKDFCNLEICLSEDKKLVDCPLDDSTLTTISISSTSPATTARLFSATTFSHGAHHSPAILPWPSLASTITSEIILYAKTYSMLQPTVECKESFSGLLGKNISIDL